MPPPLKGQSVTYVSGIPCYLSLRKDSPRVPSRASAWQASCPADHAKLGEPAFSAKADHAEARQRSHPSEGGRSQKLLRTIQPFQITIKSWILVASRLLILRSWTPNVSALCTSSKA